jgi:T5SS/PEP-CTERM-associated repeat protein
MYALTRETSLSHSASLVLEEGALLGWGHGRIVVEGGRLSKADRDFSVGDSPDTSALELRGGAVMCVTGTVRVGLDSGDRGCLTVRGEGTVLHAGSVEIGTSGRGLVEVLDGGSVCTGWGDPSTPRTTVGAYGTLRGDGTLMGEVRNQGVVSPGPVAADPRTTAGIGTLHIAGCYDQEPGGTLVLECAGTGTGGWDSLHVTSQAQFEGTLEVVRSFMLAALPDSAEVLRHGSCGGTFGTIRVRKASPTDEITVLPRHGATGLTLVLLGTLGQVGVQEPQVPRVFRVYPGFPNPFRSSTTIQFDLPEGREVTLRIYDVQGRLVRTLLDEVRYEPGTHRATWLGDDDRGRRSAAGIYFYRVEAGRDRQVRRIVKLG